MAKKLLTRLEVADRYRVCLRTVDYWRTRGVNGRKLEHHSLQPGRNGQWSLMFESTTLKEWGAHLRASK